MKLFAWAPEKNAHLKRERGIRFEAVLFHLEAGDVLDIFEHPNQDRYPGQRIYAIEIEIEIEAYVYLVPFVESETEVFLKAIIPSPKATQRYKR